MTKIEKNKYYSIREATKLIPWVNCEPSLQRLIQLDIENNNNQLFKAIILKRNKQRRYYIKGEHIIEVMKKSETGEFVPDSLVKRRK